MKSANFRKILGNSYEKGTKIIWKTYEQKIGFVPHYVNVNNDMSVQF